MQFALLNSVRVTPSTEAVAVCPCCFGEVIAKCGTVNVWHWAHKTLDACDNWSEPESEWHLSYKNFFPKDQREVVMDRHRADVVLNNGVVLELQHSYLPVEQVVEREEFYIHMIWLFDGMGWSIDVRENENNRGCSFRWKWPNHSVLAAKRETYIDLADGRILQVYGYREDLDFCVGTGFVREKADFVRCLQNQKSETREIEEVMA